MRFATLLLLTLTGALMGGCATSNCAGWSAIQPSKADRLTDGTKRQILAHNEFGVKQHCWLGR